MTDLEQRTILVPPTSLDVKPEVIMTTLEQLHLHVQSCYNMTPDEMLKYKEGTDMQKNRENGLPAVCLDILLKIIDEHEMDTQDKAAKALYLQNKKIVRDLLITVVSLLKNYNNKDLQNKVTALGTLIQSVYDTKRQTFGRV